MMAAERTTPQWHLSRLLGGLAMVAPHQDRELSGLCADSRECAAGELFFARPRNDAALAGFVEAAVARGAAAVVVEAGTALPVVPVPVVTVANLRSCLGAVADRYFDEPSRRLNVVGVTGTNGKTSVSHYIADGLHATNNPCGLIGTLGSGLFGALGSSINTTPGVIATHETIAKMYAEGAGNVIMEVSSHGLEQGRVEGIDFDTAVFTNLSRDHLDYHGDMASYAEAKRRLFAFPGLRHAIVNADDASGREILAKLPASVRAIAYSAAGTSGADVVGTVVSAGEQGLTLDVNTPWGSARLALALLGRFNAYNVLAALSAMVLSGVDFEDAVARLGNLRPVPGRMQRLLAANGPAVVVDYSHTPDALETALAELREHCRGALWCVFGAGGERDRGKRPLMGAAAARGADVLMITDDNPRGEDGERIVGDILVGCDDADEIIVERDRGAAIRRAIADAEPQDVVLIAGKGHETYQEIAGVRRAFSDAAVARAAIEERAS